MSSSSFERLIREWANDEVHSALDLFRQNHFRHFQNSENLEKLRISLRRKLFDPFFFLKKIPHGSMKKVLSTFTKNELRSFLIILYEFPMLGKVKNSTSLEKIENSRNQMIELLIIFLKEHTSNHQ